MHAIILAGGFGTRLRHVVADVPKPMAPVAGKPFLVWQMEYLAAQGVTSATLSVHHQWEKIRDYFAANPAPFPIAFAVEKTSLGTGGAMVFALEHDNSSPHLNPPPAGEGIIILNGDTFVRLDLRAMMAQHRAGGASLTMALRQVADSSRYGRVKVQNGIITAFQQGLPGETGLINAGVYIVSPRLFAGRALPPAFSFERDFVPPYLDELRPQAFIASDYFIDIGIPDDYARACRELPEAAGN